MKIRPRTEQQADFMFHKSGEEKKGYEGEQQPQQVNEEEEEEVQWKGRKRGAAAAAGDKGWRKEEEDTAAISLRGVSSPAALDKARPISVQLMIHHITDALSACQRPLH